MMIWDPTDKQGWKHALERSTSSSSPSRLSKKVRLTAASDNQLVKPINGNAGAEKKIDKTEVARAVDTATTCELSSTAPGSMQSFFRPKRLSSLPAAVAEPHQSNIYTRDSSATGAVAHAQGDHALYDVLQSPYAQASTDLNESPTSSSASTSAQRAHFDHHTVNTQSPPNEGEDITASFMTSASSSFSQPHVDSTATTQRPVQVEGMLVTSAFAKSRTLLSQVSNLSSNYPGFLFGSAGDDLVAAKSQTTSKRSRITLHQRPSASRT